MTSDNFNSQPPIQPGQRWCTNCQRPRDASGGKVKLMQKGLRCRWLCQTCAKAIEARMA